MKRFVFNIGLVASCAFCMVFIENLRYLFPRDEEIWTMEEYFTFATFDAVEIFKKPAFIFVIDNLVVLIVFLLFFGNSLAKEMGGTGVYRLIREKSRRHWYWQEMGKIFCHTLGYVITYLSVLYVICYYHAQGTMTGRESYILLWMILGTAQLLFICVLVTNITEVVFGQAFGFLAGTIFLGVLVQFCIYQRKIPLLQQVEWLRYVNPAYGMALYENGSISVIIFCNFIYLAEDLLILFIGKSVICRRDIFGTKREVDG